jgi:hypothetical protein
MKTEQLNTEQLMELLKISTLRHSSCSDDLMTTGLVTHHITCLGLTDEGEKTLSRVLEASTYRVAEKIDPKPLKDAAALLAKLSRMRFQDMATDSAANAVRTASTVVTRGVLHNLTAVRELIEVANEEGGL